VKRHNRAPLFNSRLDLTLEAVRSLEAVRLVRAGHATEFPVFLFLQRPVDDIFELRRNIGFNLTGANALQASTSQGANADAARVRALAAYKDFLTLWNDADPDIPILKEAKAEYAKLQ
jgi:hypothetical protein